MSNSISHKMKEVRRRISIPPEFLDISESAKNGIELTTQQVATMFGVTPMTLYNWRSNRALPYHHLPGGTKPPVRFDEGLVLKWAAMNGVAVVNDKYR